jgi:uncharacterized protein
LAALIALAVFAMLAFTWLSPASARLKQDRLWLVTAAGERAIDIEVAETEEEKALGLMYRTSLDDAHGMLFPYGQPQELTMWMHNTLIPLDMVFIRGDGVVHRIEERAEPMSDRIISSDGPVTTVLELAGGASARLGLKPGDHVRQPQWFPGR